MPGVNEAWPFLKLCTEKGILMPIDLLLAQSLSHREVLSEEAGAFLSLMMAKCREGHVCVCFEEEKRDPLEAKLWAMARQGAAETSLEWMREVKEGDPFPLVPIYRHGHLFYFQKNWTFETEVIHHLRRLMDASFEPSLYRINRDISELNKQQQDAVQLGMISPISLIVGGPGTGKTFTAKYLVQQKIASLTEEQREKFRIVLAAPTGKAVAHLHKQLIPILEEMKIERVLSGTLHALLRIREGDEEESPLFLLADLILVDECSMIDARLFARLLSAIPSGACLVLIGDADQLPAVGTGSFFADLMGVSHIPKTRLLECKRTANPYLAGLASALVNHQEPEALELLKAICSDLNDAVFDLLLEKMNHWGPSFLSEEQRQEKISLGDYALWLSQMERFRLLSCLRQGPWGVEALNARLFSFFCSQKPSQGGWVIPILITKNDEASQLYNGDAGILIRKITPELEWHPIGIEDYAIFPGREAIPALALPHFEYAYCLSVHKSQGSEYDEVMLIVPEGSERFGKELLYTAVTRSKKSLSIYGSLNCIEQILSKTSFKRSGLRHRLYDFEESRRERNRWECV